MKIMCVVLAAGLGKRMNSFLPKVLHTLHGTPMLHHVLNTLYELNPLRIVVVAGKHLKEIKESIGDVSVISFVQQKVPMGTGDALLKAWTALKGFQGTVVVVNGDTPLIMSKTLKQFLTLHSKEKNSVSMLSFIAEDPGSYGRVIRDGAGDIISIVEDRDATERQKKIKEVNSGVYAIETDTPHLLKEIKLNESKGEYYLTDIIGVAKDKGIKIGAYCIGSEDEFMGVNTKKDFGKVRQLMRDRIIKKWVNRGICFIDTNSVYISTDVKIDKGTIIYPNVHLEGNTRIGRGCTIYPNVRIQDSIVEDGAIIKDSTLIEGSVVKRRASVGPFAHIRPGSEIGEEVKIGNFVEVKKSVIGSRTKASHLTYLGDSKIGKNVNIGAGTITCNYDGYKKHVTIIEDNVFIGSDSQLIAPVKIGKGAYVGAGSTITNDVPSLALGMGRTRQINIKDWVLRKKLKVKKERSKRAKS
jgi:bifunctional UDP-N-acetylglucosamine pyrophosphorylase/glucosamine-1-phosphate N-acetyltransferase